MARYPSVWFVVAWGLVLVCHVADAEEPGAKGIDESGSPLFLTPYIGSGQIDLAQSLAKVGRLPLAPPGPPRESYSGFITVDSEHDSHLFFWFFPAPNQPESAPLIVWLDGGPGVSNFLSIFNQNGPYLIDPATGALKPRPQDADWTRNYSIVYVDCPVGTGFSFTGGGAYPATSEENAVDLLTFLRQFMRLFPEQASAPLHIFGESYGGHFAPALASLIHREAPQLNMKGVMLAVPWVNPYVQAPFYADYLFQLGLIDNATKTHFEAEQVRMQRLIRKGDLAEAKELWLNLISSPNSTFHNVTGFTSAFNAVQDSLDPSSFGYAAYAERPDFRAAVHAGNATYDLVSASVQVTMAAEFMESKAGHIEKLLDAGYNVTLISGQVDLTIIHRGVEAMAETLQWEGQTEFLQATRNLWKAPTDGRPAGYVRQARNLAYILLRNTGHMWLVDQPRWGLELANKFISRDE